MEESKQFKMEVSEFGKYNDAPDSDWVLSIKPETVSLHMSLTYISPLITAEGA